MPCARTCRSSGDAASSARTCHPPSPAQPGQVEGAALFAMDRFLTSSAHGDDLLETPDLGAARGVEVIDVPDALVLTGQVRQLLRQARALDHGFLVEALQHLAIA